MVYASQVINKGRAFVYLAYLDDSDTKSKHHKWQVVCGVVIEDRAFMLAEAAVKSARDLLLPLIAKDKLDKFEEFHACELYGGYGVFEGIEQSKRFEVIRRLLFPLNFLNLSVVYGAVDMRELRKTIYGSANPLDISFRMCANGIQKWLENKMVADAERLAGGNMPTDLKDVLDVAVKALLGTVGGLVILIADECDKAVKASLYSSFRQLRQSWSSVWFFHDDMYFGDSRYSIGIQLADVCSYFIARHLEGDAETQEFYDLIKPYIVHAETYPTSQVGFGECSSAG
jgi:hypothetical protein